MGTWGPAQDPHPPTPRRASVGTRGPAQTHPLIGEDPAAARQAQQHVEGAQCLPGQHMGGALTHFPGQREAFQFGHHPGDDALLSVKEGNSTVKVSCAGASGDTANRRGKNSCAAAPISAALATSQSPYSPYLGIRGDRTSALTRGRCEGLSAGPAATRRQVPDGRERSQGVCSLGVHSPAAGRPASLSGST